MRISGCRKILHNTVENNEYLRSIYINRIQRLALMEIVSNEINIRKHADALQININ